MSYHSYTYLLIFNVLIKLSIVNLKSLLLRVLAISKGTAIRLMLIIDETPISYALYASSPISPTTAITGTFCSFALFETPITTFPRMLWLSILPSPVRIISAVLIISSKFVIVQLRIMYAIRSYYEL